MNETAITALKQKTPFLVEVVGGMYPFAPPGFGVFRVIAICNWFALPHTHIITISVVKVK
jgi:hypothetical protein